MNVLYTFLHPPGGLQNQDREDIRESLQILKDPIYGVKAFEYGNEVQGVPDPQVYYDDLHWFKERVDAIVSEDAPVYGPSVTGNEAGYNFLVDYFNLDDSPWRHSDHKHRADIRSDRPRIGHRRDHALEVPEPSEPRDQGAIAEQLRPDPGRLQRT
jgi:hypothetical protein